MLTTKLLAVLIVAFFLLVLGVYYGWLKSGGLRTWLLIADGWLMLFLGYQSDGSAHTLTGILIGGAFIGLLLVMMHMAHTAMSRRTPVYRPLPTARERARRG